MGFLDRAKAKAEELAKKALGEGGLKAAEDFAKAAKDKTIEVAARTAIAVDKAATKIEERMEKLMDDAAKKKDAPKPKNPGE